VGFVLRGSTSSGGQVRCWAWDRRSGGAASRAYPSHPGLRAGGHVCPGGAVTAADCITADVFGVHKHTPYRHCSWSCCSQVLLQSSLAMPAEIASCGRSLQVTASTHSKAFWLCFKQRDLLNELMLMCGPSVWRPIEAACVMATQQQLVDPSQG